jgi:hypothetical protein
VRATGRLIAGGTILVDVVPEQVVAALFERGAHLRIFFSDPTY